MQTKLNPYIHFRDNAREGMTFYQSVFGGKLDIDTFEHYQGLDDPTEKDKVMHAGLETDNGLTLMGSDTPKGMEFNPGSTVTISLSGDNEAQLRGYFEKLSAGGMVTLPLEKAPWGDSFGMLVDKFGVEWMVNIAGKKE